MTASSEKKDFRVRAVACDYRASDEEVYAALRRATDPLDCAWDRLRRARRIAIKFNQDKKDEWVVLYEGQRQQLVTDKVARATLRLLRERTSAELYVVDVSYYQVYSGAEPDSTTQIKHILDEFGVAYVNGNIGPVRWYETPGGGQMFRQYPLHPAVAEADAIVSVQKLKSHAFMGVTLCLKNLFGLMPTQPLGRPRFYYHHLVRMPYMLADIGRILNPALNILDGTVCQAGEEWGPGEHPRIGNTLIAGDHVIATDACGAHLMGHDPQADWPTPPFHRDRNALKVAAEGGFGTVDLNEIDFASEVQAPVAEFHTKITDSPEIVQSWRRTTAEQGLRYSEMRHELARQYAGEYILMQMGEVKWHDPSGVLQRSRRILSGEHPEQAMFFKYVDPDEAEGEHFEIYARTLREMRTPA